MIPPDRGFFREYWFRAHDDRRPYEYQWFLRPCRQHAFAALCRLPPGPVLQVGRGMGSVDIGEADPSTHHVELFAELLPRGRGAVGDAQMLPFTDASVAAVWTQTVSMHLELRTFANEARRILRPSGVLALIEPLLGHPFLRLFRRLLPARKTHVSYPRMRDLEKLASLFAEGAVTPYYVFSPLLLAVPRVPRRVVARLQSLDSWLLNTYPSLSRRAWYAVALFRK